MMPLTWTADLDDYDNTYFEAISATLDEGGTPLTYVVSQSLNDNRITWWIDQSDPELVESSAAKKSFQSADAAKLWCERREAELTAKAS